MRRDRGSKMKREGDGNNSFTHNFFFCNSGEHGREMKTAQKINTHAHKEAKIKRIQYKTGLRGYVTYIASKKQHTLAHTHKVIKHQRIKREIVNVHSHTHTHNKKFQMKKNETKTEPTQ